MCMFISTCTTAQNKGCTVQRNRKGEIPPTSPPFPQSPHSLPWYIVTIIISLLCGNCCLYRRVTLPHQMIFIIVNAWNRLNIIPSLHKNLPDSIWLQHSNERKLVAEQDYNWTVSVDVFFCSCLCSSNNLFLLVTLLLSGRPGAKFRGKKKKKNV